MDEWRHSPDAAGHALHASGVGPDAAPKAQQQRMGACNSGAASRSLSGPERQRFMSDCLAGKVAPTAAAAGTPAQGASTAAPSAAQQAQQQKMRTCSQEAAKRHLAAAERRTFMSSCLSGG